MQITSAQRAAAALLPFDLSDSEIARQYAADGSELAFASSIAPAARVRTLARTAMTVQAGMVALAA